MLVLSVSTGYLCIGYDSSGGYLFFYKIFVESNRGELSKTENKLLTGRGASPSTLLGLRPQHIITGDSPIGILEVVDKDHRHIVSNGHGQNERTGR